MGMFSFLGFPLGKHLTGSTEPATNKENTHLLAANTADATTLEANLPEEDAATKALRDQLASKITSLDLAMYYLQLSTAFVVGTLQITKMQVIDKNQQGNETSTAATAINWCSALLPLTTTFVISILKKVRDDAATEASNLPPKSTAPRAAI